MRLLLTLIPMMLAQVAAAETIRVPADHRTIQAAVDSDQPGDRVIVGPGTYREAIEMTGKPIILEAETGPSRTVVDATDLNAPALTCIGSASESVVIRGFRFTGGSGDPSRHGKTATVGGGLVLRGCSLLIENCRVIGNVATYEGGGVWAAEHATPRFVRCIFSFNRADRGGGIYLNDSEGTFVDCRFISNTALFGGGGLAADSGSHVQLSDCRFEECHAAYNGGAVYVYDSKASIARCVFVRNSAGLSGGAIYQGYHAKVDLEEVEFRTIGDTVFGQWHADVSPPKGACCIEAMCIEVTRSACREAGGRWSGADTDCVAVRAAACRLPRPGDLNDDANVDIRDVAILMSLWGEQETPAD
ncbi:MAG: hypothetical protein HOI89_05580 [Phycisphaerae bacterium]|nr:hypothetical protein [Phycisphaerae bacterium]